jgi:hypothetical protein
MINPTRASLAVFLLAAALQTPAHAGEPTSEVKPVWLRAIIQLAPAETNAATAEPAALSVSIDRADLTRSISLRTPDRSRSVRVGLNMTVTYQSTNRCPISIDVWEVNSCFPSNTPIPASIDSSRDRDHLSFTPLHATGTLFSTSGYASYDVSDATLRTFHMSPYVLAVTVRSYNLNTGSWRLAIPSAGKYRLSWDGKTDPTLVPVKTRLVTNLVTIEAADDLGRELMDLSRISLDCKEAIGWSLENQALVCRFDEKHLPFLTLLRNTDTHKYHATFQDVSIP